MKAKVHTDGSCWPNPGPGGWAAIIELEDGKRVEFKGRSESATTNNRMEVTAAVKALEFFSEPADVEIITDSRYLIDGARSWNGGWSQRNWMKNGQPIKNADLWKRIWELTRKHKVRWTWVRAHANCALNNRCDELANGQRSRT